MLSIIFYIPDVYINNYQSVTWNLQPDIILVQEIVPVNISF
jgi:hypothetical protein